MTRKYKYIECPYCGHRARKTHASILATVHNISVEVPDIESVACKHCRRVSYTEVGKGVLLDTLTPIKEHIEVLPDENEENRADFIARIVNEVHDKYMASLDGRIY